MRLRRQSSAALALMLKNPHLLFTDLHFEKQRGCKYFYTM